MVRVRAAVVWARYSIALCSTSAILFKHRINIGDDFVQTDGLMWIYYLRAPPN